MNDDRKIGRRSLDLQARAKDFRLMDLPGYMEWSKRKLAEGELPGNIASLDAMSVWLLPEQAAIMNANDYEELLAETKEGLEP